MIHLTLNQISAYIDSELPEASVELVRLHLSSCLECTERFGHIEEQESAIARLLVHAPGDPYFERFSERVLGPVPAGMGETAAAVKKPAPARAAVMEPAPAREHRPPDSTSVATEPRRKGGRARLLLPVGALLLVASAVAVLATRPEIAERWRPADRAAPPAGTGSNRLQAAASRSAAANRAGRAKDHDEAAAAWERALPELQDDADELAAGRREIAVARYAAWNEGPSPERREAAMRAVRAYLLCAPAGVERERAWDWLADLKR